MFAIQQVILTRPSLLSALVPDEGVVFDHNQYVTTTVKDIKFRFKAGNFFQNNPYMLPSMVNYVVGQAKGGIGEVSYPRPLAT